MGRIMKCPNCGGTQIQLIDSAVGGTKTTLNLNPLKPFTLWNTKEKKKKVKKDHHSTTMAFATGGASLFLPKGKKKVGTEWHCQACGYRWYDK